MTSQSFITQAIDPPPKRDSLVQAEPISNHPSRLGRSKRMTENLAERLDRMESLDAIRQLASKYALAVDMRDLDAIVNLYVADVKVTRSSSGREALKASFATVLRSFRASVHHIGGHVIEFDDPDNAHGIVYCRCEHEVGGQWVPVYLYYLDLYRRENGRWYFRRRNPSELYGADVLERPQPGIIHWPGAPDRFGSWHAHFPSWAEFWEKDDAPDTAIAPEPARDAFIDSMRRGERRVVAMDFAFSKRRDA
ncbi:nuclear transport factor 2 family protein [Novosphingobium cyanobacteriorum]|uniref:Nuclear transport factor 2 family protein n=1 Tax=Novosphingobium cyanobacteriorum TaxID=3024215 RepID=A0ABT6CM74_9SPHN|nr:nuclear transport factor 2 family protein [Novosphingobium cyanobacteriorum]MDF8334962.1 nuclear transport factor 2 family protein [Novosphingobium cyanobacteriorum]